MSKLTCIIIEDEPLAVRVLAEYIRQVPFLELRSTCRDAIEAAACLREQPVDIMFLDIHLPGIKGMAFLKTLVQPPAVIITTAYHQYAVEGFDLNVTDYLLKPFGFDRFLAAVNKAARDHPALPLPKRQPDFILVTVQKRKVKVSLNEILYIESQREYIKLVCVGKTYLTKMSTHEIEALLPADRFKRIHRSFIISLDRIESYSSGQVDIHGTSIPIGRAYQGTLGGLFLP